MSEVSPQSPSADGDTRLYVIVGDPISQTQTPQALNPRFAAGGHNAILVPAHVPAAQFDVAMRGLMALQNFHGAVVTYPFKVKAMSLVDRLLPSSRHVGALNIMRRDDDGGWTGDILDGRAWFGGWRRHR